MPPKQKCYTKPRIPKSKGGAGGTYTTCVEGQKKKKKKLVVKPKAEPKKKKLEEKMPSWYSPQLEKTKKLKILKPKTEKDKWLDAKEKNDYLPYGNKMSQEDRGLWGGVYDRNMLEKRVAGNWSSYGDESGHNPFDTEPYNKFHYT